MNDLISVVLPVYNGAKYLRESIDSVLTQTYANWELIIVDDCSSDETPDIAREYAKKDGRIRYYRNEANLRLPRNLNKGFSLTKGDYLTWTSDDNRYRPDALEKMICALQENTHAQLVYASYDVIDENDDLVETYIAKKGSIKRLVGFNTVGACFLYTRKAYETVGDYDHEMILVEDYDYWQRIAMRFETVTIEQVLYDYRRHSGALTSTMRQEQFNRNREKMLLKNISGFGKLNTLQKYYFYSALYECREKLGDLQNPYKSKFRRYDAWHFVVYRVPAKLKRILQGKK